MRLIRRLCFIVGGIGLTWACAGTGLFLLGLGAGHGCGGNRVRTAVWRVREVEQGLTQFMLAHDRCPANRAELLADHFVGPRGLVDPWGEPISYACSDDDVRVVSAGPDKTFNTADDVAAP